MKSKRKKGVLEEVFSETRRQVESDMISDAWMRTGANDMWNANAADYVRHIQVVVCFYFLSCKTTLLSDKYDIYAVGGCRDGGHAYGEFRVGVAKKTREL